VRVNVNIAQDALGAIDRYAERYGMTRSGFLVRAAHAMITLDRPLGPRSDAKRQARPRRRA
jgi:hypothetical protein